MRIVRRQINPEKIKAEWQCTNCKSILEATKDEGEYIYDHRNGLDDCIKFFCLVCKFENYIDVNKFKKQ